MNLQKRLGAVAIGFCALVMAVGLTATSASAAPSRSAVPQRDNTSAKTSGAKIGLTIVFHRRTAANLSSADSTISCSVNQQQVHHSTHKPETANVVVNVKCDTAVARIGTLIAIYYKGALKNQNPNGGSTNSATASTNVAAPCQNGTWGSWFQYTVTAPPGYTPASATANGYGPASQVTC